MNENEKQNMTESAVQGRTETNKIREYSPHVDIWETEQAVYLTADMPGVSEKDVDIDLQGNTLEFSGLTHMELPEGFNATHYEYPATRRYVRQFTLGDSLDRDSITAEMKDGVLKLTLPKSKNNQPRKIVVQRG